MLNVGYLKTQIEGRMKRIHELEKNEIKEKEANECAAQPSF